jgi:hypothetical protein
VFGDDVWSCFSQEVAEDKDSDDCVVEWPEDGDELGDKVDGRREPDGADDQQCFRAARDAWIPREAFEQDEQVGEQQRDFFGGGATPDQEQSRDGVERRPRAYVPD